MILSEFPYDNDTSREANTKRAMIVSESAAWAVAMASSTAKCIAINGLADVRTCEEQGSEPKESLTKQVTRA